jgi:hypothetical protein
VKPLQQWLYDNLEREGIPYTITKESVTWKPLGQDRIAERRAPGDAGAETQLASEAERLTLPNIAPAGRGVGEGGGGEARQLSGELDALAPLPPVPPPAPPGSTVSRFLVTWEVKIKQKDPEGQA